MDRYGGNYMKVRYVQLIQGLEDDQLYGAADVVRTKYSTRHPRFEVMKRAIWAFADNNNLKFTCDNAKRDTLGRVITKVKRNGPTPVLLPGESWPKWFGRTWKTKLGGLERSLPQLLESLVVMLKLFNKSKAVDPIKRHQEESEHTPQNTDDINQDIKIPLEDLKERLPRHQTIRKVNDSGFPLIPLKKEPQDTMPTVVYLPRTHSVRTKIRSKGLKTARTLALVTLIGFIWFMVFNKPQEHRIETLTARPLPILPATRTCMMPPILDAGANKN